MAGTETDTGGEAGRRKGPGAGAGALSVVGVGLVLTGAGLLGGAAAGVADGEEESDIVDGGVELTVADGPAVDGPSPEAETPPVPQPAAASRTAPTTRIRRTRLPLAPAGLLGGDGIDSFLSDGLHGWTLLGWRSRMNSFQMDAAGPVGEGQTRQRDHFGNEFTSGQRVDGCLTHPAGQS